MRTEIQSQEFRDIRDKRAKRDKDKQKRHTPKARRNKKGEYVCFRILVEKGREQETQKRDGEG